MPQPKPKIHNAAELEALVQQMGFLPFFSCSIPNFSIEDFTPSRYWFVDGVEGPWEWRMELARRGVVAYGKLFSRKAGLVSRDPKESKERIIRHLGTLCPEAFDDDLSRLIR